MLDIIKRYINAYAAANPDKPPVVVTDCGKGWYTLSSFPDAGTRFRKKEILGFALTLENRVLTGESKINVEPQGKTDREAVLDNQAMTKKPTCVKCEYWQGFEPRKGTAQLGYCIRFPPIVIPFEGTMERYQTVWPQTYSTQRCGEFTEIVK